MIPFRRERVIAAEGGRGLSGILLAASAALLGCLAVFNATSHASQPYYFLYRQAAWLLIGLALLVVASKTSPASWHRLTWPLSIASLLALYALLIWGHKVNGMQGWFRLEVGALRPVFSPILIQPSELAKPIFVLYLARLANQFYSPAARTWRDYAKYLGGCSLWLLPLALQPDFGTLAIYGLVMLLVYWLQGGRTAHLAATVGGGLVLMALAAILHPYVWRRLSGFLAPAAHAEGAGWHILQFRVTLANGGLLGAEQAVWSHHYLPLGYSDSIFATVAERIGFLGLMPIVAVVMVWLVHCLFSARRQLAADKALIIVGLASLLALQAALHISVTLGLVPPTGITFPLLSYGGSSLAASMLAIGIVIAHAKETQSPTGKGHVQSPSVHL